MKAPSRQPAKGGRGDARQAQHGRVRHGLVERDQRLRAGDLALARKGSNVGLTAGRILGRFGGGGRRRHRTGGNRHRHGGSIRQPAAFAGICGIKPTYGRCSRWGIVAFASSLDQAGPMAKDVRDCAILLEAMAGFDPRTRLRSTCRCPKWEARLSSDLKGKRDRHPARNIGSMEMPGEINALWEQGIEWLKDAGAKTVEISLPHTKIALPAYYIIAPAEASSNLARYDGVRYGLARRPSGYSTKCI